MFGIGKDYPPIAHLKRIKRYKDNKKLFLGNHYDVFERVNNHLTQAQSNMIYISLNLAGIICKKSADFLFGETPIFSAGKEDNSPEQLAFERMVTDNHLNITNYESALGNAFRGDSFYKLRYGQMWGGVVPEIVDPYRVFIEAQNAEYVFPETLAGDASKIFAYHIAYPSMVADHNNEWILHVESHYPTRVISRQFRMNPMVVTIDNEITSWKIYAEIAEAYNEITHNIPFALVVHVPNYSLDSGWEGIDDLTEHRQIFDEINNRLSKISEILDKHSDPAIVVPAGTLGEDEHGNPSFRVGVDKVFEVMGKDDVLPQYIVWNGQLEAAFKELDMLIQHLLTNAEIPAVALGAGDSGTSGSSGISIKWRMNSLLAKINRKRQYYDKALKQVMLIAQLMEHELAEIFDYEITPVKIKFKDGLPNDDLEQATIMQIRTGAKATISTKTALMNLDGLTDEQAEFELSRINDEEAISDPSIFNTDKKNPMKGTPNGGNK